jgi:hypothetical protein
MDGEPTTEDAEQTMVGQRSSAAASAQEFVHSLIFSGDAGPVRVLIGAEGVTIGRIPPAEVTIAHPEISRRHSRIDIKGDHAILSDLGSTNGTHVDGVRLQRPKRLLSGEQFTLGTFPFRYERRNAREHAEQAELAADLKRAEAYVRAILPQPITTGPLRVEGCFIPSATLGGDAYGYQFLSDEVFASFLLDVSGHGIGSAIHAANVANTLRRRALPGVDFRDPAQVAAGLNQVFPMEEHNGLMLTLWYFAYHLPTRRMLFCSAGHHPSLLFSPDTPEPAPLWLRSPAIGMLPFGKWTAGAVEIPPGARLLLFSDGAFEIVARDGRQWGMQDLRQKLVQLGIRGFAEPQRVYQAVREAARPGPLDDDFTMLMVTFD